MRREILQVKGWKWQEFLVMGFSIVFFFVFWTVKHINIQSDIHVFVIYPPTQRHENSLTIIYIYFLYPNSLFSRKYCVRYIQQVQYILWVFHKLFYFYSQKNLIINILLFLSVKLLLFFCSSGNEKSVHI